MDLSRFVRQVLLPEIGEAGQARLGEAEAAVGGAGLAHEVAARYAEGAGFGAVVAGPIDVDALAPPAIVRTDAAREALAGARAALAEIRRAVGMEARS
jgi:molybdopterin/thiamine biosynthesis adenylyltransferase